MAGEISTAGGAQAACSRRHDGLASRLMFCGRYKLFGRCSRNGISPSGRYLMVDIEFAMKGKCDVQDHRSAFATDLALARSEQ
jgi:hypothetical protein